MAVERNAWQVTASKQYCMLISQTLAMRREGEQQVSIALYASHVVDLII